MAISSLKGFRRIEEALKEIKRFKAEAYNVSLLPNSLVHIEGPQIDEVFPGKYPLRTYQKKFHEAYFKEQKRLIYLAWSRRLGKEFSCFSLAVALCMLHPYYKCVFIYPFYSQGVDILWEGVFNVGDKRIPLRNMIPKKIRDKCRFDKVKNRIRFPNGSGIDIAGSDNMDALRGKNYSFYCLSEHAWQRSDLLDVIVPIVTNLGKNGTLIVQTTWIGRNHSWRLYQDIQNDPNWYADFQTVETAVDENGIRYMSEEQVEVLRKTYSTEHKFRQEMFMDVTGNTDQYYFAEVLSKMKELNMFQPYEKVVQHNREVYAFWDLGARDANVIILVQFYKDIIVIIKAFKNRGRTHSYHLKECLSWAEEKGLKIVMHYLPHDGDNISAMVSGDKAQSLFGYMTKVLKLHAKPVEKPQHKNIAIQYARTLLSRCTIAEDECKSFLEDLRDYQKVWDEKANTFKEAPGTHWCSHSVDALQTLGISYLNRHIPIDYYNAVPIPYGKMGELVD